MSTEAFPIIYFNMSGEMMYIIQQRLLAQNIETEKANKVLNDILSAIYGKEIIKEVFKRQYLLFVPILKQMFAKLAHVSIMKLNDQSMNKLFDLMLMVFKYQLVVCNTPLDVLQITMNHFTSLHEMTNSDEIKQLIQSAKGQFFIRYSSFNGGQIQRIRYTILTFLHDFKTRVSIFLREGIQENDGLFVIKTEGIVSCECQIPGELRYFDSEGKLCDSMGFASGCKFEFSDEKTTLGLNIYKKEESLVEESLPPLPEKSEPNVEPEPEPEYDQTLSGMISEDGLRSDKTAEKELEILAKLIGQQQLANTKGESAFWLSLEYNNNSHDDAEDSQQNINELDLSQGIHINKNLENVMSDLKFDDSEDVNCSDGDNLLQLMDS